MRKLLLASAAVTALAFGSAHAATVVVEPEVDTWVMEQPDSAAVTIDGDIIVGSTLPDTVQMVEVPKHSKYRYAVVNKKRVLIDGSTRKVVKVY